MTTPHVPQRLALATGLKVPQKPVEESPLAAAVRDHLRKFLDKPLTVASLRDLGRTVGASVKLLLATQSGVDNLLPQAKPRSGIGIMSGMGMGQVDETDEYTGGAEVTTGSSLAIPNYGLMGAENVGNTFLRELVGMAGKNLGLGAKGGDPDVARLESLNKLLATDNLDTEVAAAAREEVRAVLADMKAKREASKPKATPEPIRVGRGRAAWPSDPAHWCGEAKGDPSNKCRKVKGHVELGDPEHNDGDRMVWADEPVDSEPGPLFTPSSPPIPAVAEEAQDLPF